MRDFDKKNFKKAFHNYSHMTAKLKRFLADNKFDIVNSKKHWKLVYIPTGQVFILPKTPSDFRSGMNFSSKVILAIGS